MIPNFEIDEILSVFTHHESNYIHFSLKKNEKDFLYLIAKDETIISLFFGNNFRSIIPVLRSDPGVQCIECDMGLNIQGGVSYDSEDLVEFNLSTAEANSIIDLLKNCNKSEEIKFELRKFHKNMEN